MERLPILGNHDEPFELFEEESGSSHPERARQERYIREYPLPKEVRQSLSKEQLQLLGHLIRAARRIDDLFGIQESEDFSFWPERIGESEIEAAAQSNSDIKSPYTVVRRNNEGDLVAIPVHVVFQDLIRETRIADSLEEAAHIARKGKFKDLQLSLYLKARSQAFNNGNWEYSESLWLPIGSDSKIMAVIGPYDNYLDPLKRKYAWESWVGVLDVETTETVRDYKERFLNWLGEETDEVVPKVAVRVDHTVIMSGQAAKYKWTGNSLPCQAELRREYGSVFTIFKPVFEDRLKHETLPTFRLIIDPSHRFGVTNEMIREVELKMSTGHEIGHSKVAQGIEQRLGGSSAWVKELFCNLLSLKGILALAESKREAGIALALAFVNAFLDFKSNQIDGSRYDYFVADCIMLNYCLEKRVVDINEGRLSYNSTEGAQITSELFDEIDQMQENGARVNSHWLFRNYYQPEVFSRFAPGS
ncbi:hypothetical protein A3G14_03380 [Candidatus Curtissbacteria bacterium RIFCSPLOWO2_12_FULL_38_9]|uniref:Uncharacterized protein n=1 Tax=Candidatus Curtissbacteria bacterium RIFCSPLOWO2_12_FULL_38_9 TaxID=1797735 RepID=A0A1F5IBP3_9BACT|nr:MAG: hypothetical protein A3G14_03380 [Candidatus Curtissbacteria bacterium RIFCSPLOWO2_12_FULL_38_9]